MSQRFSYVKYDKTSQAFQQSLKKKFEAIEEQVEVCLPNGRAKSLLLTHLEIAYMWSGKAIRDDQIARTGDASEQVERSSE